MLSSTDLVSFVKPVIKMLTMIIAIIKLAVENPSSLQRQQVRECPEPRTSTLPSAGHLHGAGMQPPWDLLLLRQAAHTAQRQLE